MSLELINLLDSVAKLLTTLIPFVAVLVGALLARRGAHRETIEALAKGHALTEDEKKAAEKMFGQTRLAIYVLAGGLLLIGVGTTAWYLAQPFSHGALSNTLVRHDSALFRDDRDGLYEIARVIPYSRDIERDTDLKSTLASVQNTMDFMLHSGGSRIIDIYKADILDCVRRGARVRIIVSDIGEKNRPNLMAFCQSMGDDIQRVLMRISETQSKTRDLIDRVNRDRSTYKGTLELKLSQCLPLFTMWIKDAQSPSSAMAHLTPYIFHDDGARPSFRVAKAGPELIKNLAQEFEYLWNRAVPAESRVRR